MKTYEVSVRPIGVKRICATYTVHADSKTRAEAVAETAFSQDELKKYQNCVRWICTAKEVK